MKKESCLAHIEAYLAENDAAGALRLIADCRSEQGESATLYCLEGKAHMKRSDWRNAQNAFLKANQLEPDGPAQEYLHMLGSIMDFYNKDMYNQ